MRNTPPPDSSLLPLSNLYIRAMDADVTTIDQYCLHRLWVNEPKKKMVSELARPDLVSLHAHILLACAKLVKSLTFRDRQQIFLPLVAHAAHGITLRRATMLNTVIPGKLTMRHFLTIKHLYHIF